MGQITVVTMPSLILSATDRLQSANAGSGMSPASANVILLGEDAGSNITSSRLILLGKGAGKTLTVNDVIVVGENSFDANGGVTPIAAATKSIVIGNGSLRDWQFTAGGDSTALPMLVIGHNVAPFCRANNGSVLIGNDIMSGFVGGTLNNGHGVNVVIGVGSVAGAQTQPQDSFAGNVCIGDRILPATNFNAGGANGNVFIGSKAGGITATPITLNNNICIGAGSGGSAGGTTYQNNILMGSAVFGTFNVTNNVTLTPGTGGVTNGDSNVTIGTGQQAPLRSGFAGHPDLNIIIGGNPSGAQAFPVDTTGLVVLGAEVRSATLNYAGAAANYDFFVGNGIVNKMLMYGNQNNGCLTIGNDVPNRVVGTNAVNCLKIINGKRVPLGPGSVGGAYFYSDDGTTFAAGDMRVVTPGGADWNLTPQPTTVAALPLVATVPVGQRRTVTDALAPAYGAIVAGGGAVVQSVMCNGANWVCM